MPAVDNKVKELITVFEGEEFEESFKQLVNALPLESCNEIIEGMAGNRDIPTRVKLFSNMIPEYRELVAQAEKIKNMQGSFESSMKYRQFEKQTLLQNLV